MSQPREPRCGISDLPVSSCGHCKGIKEPVRDPGFMFFAHQYGPCSACPVRIEPGDTICADGQGGYQHEHCADRV